MPGSVPCAMFVLTAPRVTIAKHWLFLVDGKSPVLPLQPTLTATDSAPLVALALSGLGVTRHFYFWLRK